MPDFEDHQLATSADAIRRLTAAFAAAGIEAPDRDARLLVAGLAGLDPSMALIEPRPLTADVVSAVIAAMARRLAHEPVSRILGRRGFYGRDFFITPATLDPRPDTETIVEAALAIAAREGWRDRPIRVLDVGTGSGAILVTLLAELPHASGLGTDIDPDALAVARLNAAQHGVASRAAWRCARSLDDIAGPFDLLVSNPPYIPTALVEGLDAEVLHYDPRAALDGGEDGLQVYRAILARVAAVVPAGWVCFEVGRGQAHDVIDLAARAGLKGARKPTVFKDLGGIERCVALQTQL